MCLTCGCVFDRRVTGGHCVSDTVCHVHRVHTMLHEVTALLSGAALNSDGT